MAKPSVGTAISRGEKASNTQRQLFRLESDFFQSQFFATKISSTQFSVSPQNLFAIETPISPALEDGGKES